MSTSTVRTGTGTGRAPAAPPAAGATGVRGRARALLGDHGPEFFRSSIDGAPPWVAGALSAAQGALLSLLALVLPALASFVATSADPTNAEVPWARAAAVGASVWLLGHGVAATIAGTEVSLVPLGVTALAVLCSAASARRSGVVRRSAAAGGAATYAVITLLVALALGASGPRLLAALLGGLLVGGAGIGLGLLARPDAPALRSLSRPLWTRVPHPVRVGAAAGVLVVALLLLAASALTVVWTIGGIATIGDVVRALGLDAVGGAVLGVGQLAYVPDLVLWNVSWLAGPGFAVGSGTRFAPTDAVAGPLPAVPLLGALPTPDQAAHVGVLCAALLLVLGVTAGWYVHRRLVVARARDAAVAVGALTVSAGAVTVLLMRAAAGSVGPGRMADVGPAPWAVGGAVALAALLGSALVAWPADRAVRAAVVRVARTWRAQVAVQAAPAPRPHDDEHDDEHEDRRDDQRQDTRDGQAGDEAVTAPVPQVPHAAPGGSPTV